MKKIISIAWIFLLAASLPAQTIVPQGFFLEDSVKIGFPVHYSLSVSHSPSTQIVFPDSNFNYFPFELIRKVHFPTRTKEGKSTDSAIYILRTFNLDKSQQLALPVYILNEGDTTSVYSSPTAIWLKEYLSELPLTVVFKEQTDYFLIKKEFNYPYLLAWIAALIILFMIVFFFFGKSIKRRYRLYIMRIDHNHFLKDFQKMQERFSSLRDLSAIEQGLSIWKNYLARLEHKPIYTYTTTEIINLFQQEELKNGLNVIDRAIYGGLISDEADKAISNLKKFSVRQYHKRKREVQNG
jgi:hypothetical protein